MAEQRDTCADCGSEIDETVCWCGTLRTDHGGFGENHSFVPMGCNCHRAMPDPTNDLRSHALHQKSKEPPDVPSITAEEAAVLRTRLYHPSLLARAHARIALHGWDDENAAVGEAALARYDEEQRQANEAKLNEQWRRKWELAVDTIAERVGVIQRMEELLRRGVALERTYGPDAVTLMATNLAWKDEVTKFLNSGKSIREGQP